MDFLAGLMMIVIGGGAFYMALDFPFGSALRMGPGYFPRVLAGIFMLFGVIVMIRGLASGEPIKGRWGFKPLAFITVGLVAFGFTMEHWGMLPALLILFLIACGANHFYRIWEVLIMWAVMSAFAVLVFIYLVGLPYPLIGAY
jgi:hypothetical protein